MDIKQLQYFIEVAKVNSFTRAADRLFITQPTISKMIKNLETELGVTLFDRSRKQLVLTDVGKVIFEEAKLVDQAFHNLELNIDNLTGLKTGHIRIGLPPIFNAEDFLKITGMFHEEYPGITFQFEESGSKKIEEDIENNLLDVGVIVLPTQNELFDHYAFMEEDLMLILHPSHPLSDKEVVDLAQLENESFILFNKDFVLNDRIIQACNLVGFQPHIISESAHLLFIEGMVANKFGVSLLPQSICTKLGANVRYIRVENPTIRWSVAIIWAKNQYISYAAKQWLHFTINRLNGTKQNNRTLS
ncbi:LysR family transcriptional regulator [Bacillus sp. T3]|uniref:LysR family transcriptional regulator n=1 Tax=Bacillus sp. T3 TaxID=467262 RepID=UPI003993853B